MARVEINQRSYYYEIAGGEDRRRPTLVLLHGCGGDGRVWQQQLEGLADIATLIVPDLPGHGRSPGRAGGSAREAARWLEDFAAALELESFWAAGHSLGGAVVQEYACAFSRRLRGLVLAGTAMRFSVSEAYLSGLENDFEAAVETSCRHAYTAKAPPALCRQGLEMLRANGPQTLYRDMLACVRFDSSAWAAQIQKPALVVCGEEDRITPRKLSAALAGQLPRGRLKVLAGAGHMVMQEAPEVFNGLVKNLVAGAED